MTPFLKFRTIAGLALGVFLFPPLTSAQQGGQPGPTQGTPAPPGGAPGVGATPSPGGRTPLPGSTDRNQIPQLGERDRSPSLEMQRPIFLSGKVVLQDGTAPQEPVVIERVCNGVPRQEGYTDSKGRFSFQLGQNMGMMQDASISSASEPGFGGASTPGMQRGGLGSTRGGINERDLMGCELRAVLPGFRSETVNLAGRRMFDNPDVGTIVLRRLGNVEGLTISATSLQAPKDAKKAFDKGREILKKKKLEDKHFEEALKEFEKAVEIYPKYAVAWFELGRLYEHQKNVEEARKAYTQSLAADSKYVSPYLQLALMSAQENKWQDVADTTDRLLKLNPVDFPRGYFYNAVANFNLKKFDAAEKSAREAQKLDTKHQMPKVDHLLGLILYEKRDFSGAADQIRSYLKFAPSAQDAGAVRQQLSEIEKLSGPNAKVTTGQEDNSQTRPPTAP